jgi:hypothetical protein
MYVPVRDEVTGGWRKLHNEELHNFYSSSNIIWMIKLKGTRWAGQVVRIEKMRNSYKILVQKAEGKKPLGRSRRIWGDNIKMDLKGIGLECVDCNHLAQDRDRWRATMNTVINGFHKMQGIS